MENGGGAKGLGVTSEKNIHRSFDSKRILFMFFILQFVKIESTKIIVSPVSK